MRSTLEIVVGSQNSDSIRGLLPDVVDCFLRRRCNGELNVVGKSVPVLLIEDAPLSRRIEILHPIQRRLPVTLRFHSGAWWPMALGTHVDVGRRAFQMTQREVGAHIDHCIESELVLNSSCDALHVGFDIKQLAVRQAVGEQCLVGANPAVGSVQGSVARRQASVTAQVTAAVARKPGQQAGVPLLSMAFSYRVNLVVNATTP